MRKSASADRRRSLIKNDESVLLDSGTTALQVARHIEPDASLVVVTNDVGIMNELVTRENVQLVFLGGTLRRKNLSFYGTQTERALQDLHVDKLILAADGFDIEKGLTTHFEPEALLNRMMCRAASEIIVSRRLLQIRPDLPAQGSRTARNLEAGDRHGNPGVGPRSADPDRGRGHHRVKVIREVVARHKAGRSVGVYSACSAHPLVIEAALNHVRRQSGPVLIEATSNQVNQDGGYTGMRPADFSRFVLAIAARLGVPSEQVLLGGDHLGPNCWQDLPAEAAMVKSEQLIADYVAAGFRKIHLDCSMSCADDPTPLTDAIVAQRAARLCVVAEKTWSRVGGEAPVYVVGTEVPVPGGAKESLTELALTEPTAAAATIDAHCEAFQSAGLHDVWPRVIGLVVQPGVEFDHHKVIDFHAARAADLAAVVEAQPYMVYEAHSTDYQTPANLRALVQRHFAILKVGPGLTFAMREALWGLDEVEREWLGADRSSRLRETVQQAMTAAPRYWNKYYLSDGRRLTLDQQYSLSDRIRYYWPAPEVETALNRLLANLDSNPPPLTLLSQYLPLQYEAIRAGRIGPRARELVLHSIEQVLQQYSAACADD